MIRKMVCSLGAFLVLAGGVANAEILLFKVSLDGAQAADCAGTGSSSTGTATFTLDTATNEVTYNIEYSALDGTENGAHVHGKAAECAPGGIVYPLPAGSPKVGVQTLSAGEATDMINGLHYVNIHSTVAGGGEIRGQILPVAVPTMSTWGMAATALLVLTAGTITFNRRRRLTA